ncbi:S-layer homology domain-containing protein [Papillibacter cinnamivorans]|uniref:S-layer homology domain-containing protein n=1 Tax=Papillibacter cinnamivorans DSM 12816 TaxID=1122930 RepID=A0A1W2C1L8_9FIRM|nr:S-layer homology domain-containing protein [Papillibacter cinnamivorans]SMC78981.1 S-layer homology domain-containing protein [Papillibacter cinnamivorans DSM 12816]
MKKTYRKWLALALVLSFCLALAPMPAHAAADDVTGHWAEETLRQWESLGLLKGDGTGNLNPDRPVTRAEWMALVNRVMGYTEKSDAVGAYSDVSAGDWYYDDARIALAAGYIGGTSGRTLSPRMNLTREQAVTMLARMEGIDPDDVDPSVLLRAGDADAVSSWAEAWVAGAMAEGLVGGNGAVLKPSADITRAETVVMLDRVRTDSRIFAFPGEYGPTVGSASVGSVQIAAPGVTLKNYEVSGDVVLSPLVEDGDVRLENVRIGGTLYINGGGDHSVTLVNLNAAHLVLLREDGLPVRIMMYGNSSVGDALLGSGAILVTRELVSGGIGEVILSPDFLAGGTVELQGPFPAVTNRYPGAAMILTTADIGTLHLMAPAVLTGTGSILLANVDAGAGEGSSLPVNPDSMMGAGALDVTISAPVTGGGGGGLGGGGGTPAVTTGTLNGAVLDGTAPLAGADVSLTVSGTEYSAVTSAGGTYSIAGIPEGTGYTVTASKFGYVSGSFSADIAAGETSAASGLTLTRLAAVFTKVAAIDDSAGKITLMGVADPIPFEDAVGYEALKIGDYVNYTVADGVYTIQKAELFHKTISSYTQNAHYVFFSGVRYDMSENKNDSGLNTLDPTDFPGDWFSAARDVYLDPFGDIVAFDPSSRTIEYSSGYVVLTKAEINGGVYQVEASNNMFSYETLTVNTDDSASMDAFNACDKDTGDIPILVRASVTRSVITMTAAPELSDDIVQGFMRIGSSGGTDVNADEDTRFIYYSTSDGSMDTYIGVNNTPTIDGSLTQYAYVLTDTGGEARTILIVCTSHAEPEIVTSVGLLFVYDNSIIIKTEDSIVTYTYQVLMNGSKCELVSVNDFTSPIWVYLYVTYKYTPAFMIPISPLQNDPKGLNGCLSGTVSSFDSGVLTTQNGSCTVPDTLGCYIVGTGGDDGYSNDYTIKAGDTIYALVLNGEAAMLMVFPGS